MIASSEKSEWQKLRWAEKVQICQQRIAQEDSLLIAYVVIFIGLEAIFATVVASRILHRCFDVPIAVLGIVMAIIYMLVCKRRGDMVDHWSVIFYSLWKQVPPDEVIATSIKLNDKELMVKAKDIGEDYKGCVERLTGGWGGWKPNIFGWPPWSDRLKFWLKSGRRLVTIFTPFLVIIIWIFILVTN